MFIKEKNANGSSLNGNSATLISAGTTLNGDVASENDLRIDGTVKGNVICSAKVIIGTTGLVEGNIMAGKLQIEPTAIFNGRCQMLMPAAAKPKKENELKKPEKQPEVVLQ